MRGSTAGFGEVEIVPDLGRGMVSVAQSNGIAGIASNTVLFGWRERRDEMAIVLRAIEDLSLLRKSSVICRPVPQRLAACPPGGASMSGGVVCSRTGTFSCCLHICCRSIPGGGTRQSGSSRSQQPK